MSNWLNKTPIYSESIVIQKPEDHELLNKVYLLLKSVKSTTLDDVWYNLIVEDTDTEIKVTIEQGHTGAGDEATMPIIKNWLTNHGVTYQEVKNV